MRGQWAGLNASYSHNTWGGGLTAPTDSQPEGGGAAPFAVGEMCGVVQYHAVLAVHNRGFHVSHVVD